MKFGLDECTEPKDCCLLVRWLVYSITNKWLLGDNAFLHFTTKGVTINAM